MSIPLKQYWDFLANYLKPQSVKVLLLTLLLFGSIGLQLINPQILRYFIDSALEGVDLQTLTVAALFFLGVAIAKYVVNVGASYLSEDVGWTATNALRANLALHCLRLDMSFHNSHTTGELIERIDGDVQVLANFFSKLVIQVLGNVLLLLGVLFVLFFEDWQVGMALTVYAVIVLVVLFNIRDLATSNWKQVRQANADLFGYIEERLSGTEDIRANGAVAFAMQRLFKHLREVFRKQIRTRIKVFIMRNITSVLIALGNVVALALSVYFLLRGEVTIGTVFLIYHYTIILSIPLMQLTGEIENLQQAGGCIKRIEDLYNTRSSLQDGSIMDLPSGPLAVEFQNVSFSYGDTDKVLHDLSFQLPPRKILGLIGRTGSGKTTIARLILRFYDSQKGIVRLGGRDLRTIHTSVLRKRIAIVMQNVQLFHATVRDNLTLFNPSITDDRILRSMSYLGLDEWLKVFPQGLNTELRAGDNELSAGQAQLLAFVRVFLGEPDLIILDEASSRLDPITEQLVESAMDHLFKNRTGIIIAHRLKTIHRADEIMILEDGGIREHGKRDQLVSDPQSLFSHLLQTGLEEVLK